MIPRPPSSTRPYTLVPCTTLFRSDPIDARRQRVEVEREAGPVRGRCEADFAVRRARVGEKDDVAIVADLLGSIETESRNVDTGEAKGNGDFTAAADAEIG